jgi:cell division protein FtsB
MLKAENDRLEKEISRLEAEIKKIIYDDEGN